MHIQPTDFLKHGTCNIGGDSDDSDSEDKSSRVLQSAESCAAAVEKLESLESEQNELAAKEQYHNDQLHLVLDDGGQDGVHHVITEEEAEKNIDFTVKVQTAYLKDEIAHHLDRHQHDAPDQVKIAHQTTSQINSIQGVSGTSFTASALVLTSHSGSHSGEHVKKVKHEREIILL